MKNFKPPYHYFALLLLWAGACVKPYEPKVIKESSSLLVVDGIINCAPNSPTNIQLTRTRKLSDTVTFVPELHALIAIEAEDGAQYALQEKDSGRYESLPLTLNQAGRYRLRINTTNGGVYVSDFVPVTPTPPVDSLNWKQDGNKITVYASTHDPQNNTHYYRWEYIETWEYLTPMEATINFTNGHIVFRRDDELTHVCWQEAPSTDIVQQSTAQLSEDVVKQAPIATLNTQTQRFMSKYSMLVNQYALTKEAYEYWQILKRNTQQLGSIFDAQPSQLIGNLHNAVKDDEPVIGFITAATVQQKRLFIRRAEITHPYTPQSPCIAKVIPTDSAAFYVADHTYEPAYYVGSGGGAIAITTLECIDCRLAGGTNIRPTFWR